MRARGSGKGVEVMGRVFDVDSIVFGDWRLIVGGALWLWLS